MSLTSYEEIGRVGRVGRGCYEENGPVEFDLYLQRFSQCGRRRPTFAAVRTPLYTTKSVVLDRGSKSDRPTALPCTHALNSAAAARLAALAHSC